MSFLGKKITLKGKSQKGKNRVRENSSQWIVLAETDRVLFNPVIGDWLFIAPFGQGQDHKSSRWIRAVDDPDFEIED